MSTLKRFRPSIEFTCSHSYCVEPPSTVPCAHCPFPFCLRHLVEHQTAIDHEHKHLLSSVETDQTRLKNIQFEDNRYELFQQLEEWQKNIIENVERMKNEINVTYEQCDQQFNVIKENALSDDQNEDMSLKEISINLKQSLSTLESSRLGLVLSKSNPTIRLIKPEFNSSQFFDSRLTTPPDLDHFLLKSDIVFTLDYDPTDTTLFTTSPQHILLYQSSRSMLELLDRTGQRLYSIHYDFIHHGDLNQLIWSPHANGFLLATSKQLLKLNCTTKRLGRYTDIGLGFYKDICAEGESILLVHHLGTSLGDVIEHYTNNQLKQRCWKTDLYPDETPIKDAMEVFRIRMSSHLVAIDTLFMDKILVCDVLCAMRCLFRIDTKHCAVLSMSPVYDTQQWILFVTDAQDEQDESFRRRIFVINARETNSQQRMREIKCNQLLPTSVCFFGPDHYVLTRTENVDEDHLLFECRKMHHILSTA